MPGEPEYPRVFFSHCTATDLDDEFVVSLARDDSHDPRCKWIVTNRHKKEPAPLYPEQQFPDKRRAFEAFKHMVQLCPTMKRVAGYTEMQNRDQEGNVFRERVISHVYWFTKPPSEDRRAIFAVPYPVQRLFPARCFPPGTELTSLDEFADLF